MRRREENGLVWGSSCRNTYTSPGKRAGNGVGYPMDGQMETEMKEIHDSCQGLG